MRDTITVRGQRLVVDTAKLSTNTKRLLMLKGMRIELGDAAVGKAIQSADIFDFARSCFGDAIVEQVDV